jgi:hypothetical protein
MRRFRSGDRAIVGSIPPPPGPRGENRKPKKLLADSMVDMSTPKEMLGKNF